MTRSSARAHGASTGVRVRQHDVVADRPQHLQLPARRGVHHLHHVEAAVGRDRHVPQRLERVARRLEGHEPGSSAGSHPMCAAPCTLFWPRSGLMPDAGLADVAGQQREVDERHHALGALDVLGHAEAVDDHRGLGRGVKPCGLADRVGVHAADVRDLLGRQILRRTAANSSYPSRGVDERSSTRPSSTMTAPWR